jgi:DNA mismatch repair protein MutS
MAQAGLFVPCSKFCYKPYQSIFSRILGTDNLFKGLSTFAVEMSELRVILRLADENSLILGDELCSGTETESALSIFVAGLTEMHSNKSSHIFATHFHEIIHYDEIKELSRLSLKHMAVYYDRELDALVYDRKLNDGPGNRMYGLEVCKSLHLSEDFLKYAYHIRSKYFPETKGELSHPTSRYNAAKIRGVCELCEKEIGAETHHLYAQADADEDGYIEQSDGNVIHKNHPGNLMSVCEVCHDQYHASGEDIVLLRKKTSRGYKIVT